MDFKIARWFFVFILIIGLLFLLYAEFVDYGLLYYIIGAILYGFGSIVLVLVVIFEYFRIGIIDTLILKIVTVSIFSILIYSFGTSEFFKSKKIFSANTVGRSFGYINLTLRKNGVYELTSNSMVGSETQKGKYQLLDSRIILEGLEDNYIPDTLTIFCHKIPIHLQSDGSFDFKDTYFRIFYNDIIDIGKDCPREFDYGWSPNQLNSVGVTSH